LAVMLLFWPLISAAFERLRGRARRVFATGALPGE
jgi:hypothetical protein